MTMNNDLMLAVLSMAAYKDTPDHQIGFAIQVQKQQISSTGFAAVAYNYDGKTVISYRGSDTPLVVDAFYGWGGGIFGAETTQAGQAALFYKSVADQQDHVGTFPYSANIEFTGHSLGGGLAGLMADLYGKTAVVFDNMAYTDAISKTYRDATSPSILLSGPDEAHYGDSAGVHPIIETR